jgi:hypothetical protein
MTEFMCPRRSEGSFTKGPDHWREDNTCSYCGSLNPDAFMERVEMGDVTLGATDKNYKVYITNNGGASFKQTYRDCPKDKEMISTAGNKYMTSSCDKGWDECTHWVTRDTSRGKFYFMHLLQPQQARFIELLNGDKIKFDGGMRFYVLPYFIQRKPTQESA